MLVQPFMTLSLRLSTHLFNGTKDGHPFVLCCDDVGLLQCELSEVYQYAAEAIVACQIMESKTELTTDNKALDFENDATLIKKVGHVAWQLAMNAIDLTFASPDVKSSLRRAVTAHRWNPNVS